MRFSVAFQESTYCVNGSDTVHITITSDTVADSNHQFTFTTTLYSTHTKYSQTFTTLMPTGSQSVTIPYVVPMAWANDTNVVDTNGDNGSLGVTLSVVYVLTSSLKQYTYTYNGYYDAIPATVEANLLPSVGTISYTSVDSKVPASWNCLVQGVSVVRVSVPQAAGIYGSDIYYYYFNGGTAQMQNYADISLRTAGNVTIPVTVEDSRGRLATADLYLVVQEYSAPVLTQISSQRCDADATLAEEGACFLSTGTLVGNSVGGRNTISVSAAWKKVTEDTYGQALAVQPASGTIVEANLEEGASYDIKYTIQDAFYSIDIYDYLSSTVYLLHFLKGGSGIAVGKAAEQASLFDVALNTTMRRDVTVGGDVSIVGELSLGDIAVKDALQSLQTPSESQFSVNTAAFALSGVTQNRIVRYGRMVMYAFEGVIGGSSPPLEGQEYVVGTIPAGYFSASFLPQISAMLNATSPCYVTISSIGQVKVTLSASYQQNIRLTGVGLVMDA